MHFLIFLSEKINSRNLNFAERLRTENENCYGKQFSHISVEIDANLETNFFPNNCKTSHQQNYGANYFSREMKVVKRKTVESHCVFTNFFNKTIYQFFS